MTNNVARGASAFVLLPLLATVPAPAFARALDARDLAPYFADRAGTRARAAMDAGRYGDAVVAYRRLVRLRRRHKIQARFLLAHALLRNGDNRAASREFRRLVRSYPLLADYARYHAAIALQRSGQPGPALRLARTVSPDCGLGLDARLLAAELSASMDRYDDAAAIWRDYLAEQPKGRRRAEGLYAIAMALASRRGPTKTVERARREALQKLKEIVVTAPLSSWRAKAEATIAKLVPLVPEGKALATLDGADIYRQSRVYYRYMRNEAAEKGFERAIKAGLSPELACEACYHQAHSIYKQRQRGRAAPVFARCVEICRDRSPLLTVKSLFNLGRGLRNQQRYDEAIKTFELIERDFADHSYADDARLLTAEILAGQGRDDEVERVLDSLPKRYPNGDMAREALWRLAFRAYSKGDLGAALKQLDRVLSLGRAKSYRSAGQALYWKARIFERRGELADARKNYEEAIRQYPLSYYALMAFNRLRERHGRRYRALHRELIAPVGRRAGRWRIPRAKETSSPAFRRGLELAKLGFGELAERELARAGFSVAKDRSNDHLWWTAVLYDNARLWHLSHIVPRYRDRRYRRTYPLEENARRWRIAYPRAFHPLVATSAKHAGIPAELAWAVMREESAFKPWVESYANAVGLMQLILPTARAAAAFHGLTATRQTLQAPPTNIRLGTTYLGYLLRTFGGLPPLAIAGYNGGQGAVFNWLNSFRGSTLDELIERIPYDQTRGYTKRVLSSLFAYYVLYEPRPGRRVPRIGFELPRLDKLPPFAPPKRAVRSRAARRARVKAKRAAGRRR